MHKKGRYVKNKANKAQASKKASSLVSKVFLIIFISIFVLSFGLPILKMISDEIPLGIVTSLIAIVVTIINLSISSKKCKNLMQRFSPAMHIFNIAAYGISLLISVANPVSDIIYYIAVGIVLIAVVCTNFSIINKRNIRATRKLPQFNKTGGDNSVWD